MLISAFSSIGNWFIPQAYAQDWLKYCAPLGVCGTGDESFLLIFFTRLAQLVFQFIGIVCVLTIIYGGMRIIASAGNDTQRDAGKNAIIAALVGLVFAILGNLIIGFIANFIQANF